MAKTSHNYHTHNSKLPLLMSQQAQKEVTVNEALTLIDALLNSSVKEVDVVSPPTNSLDGDIYIINATPEGEWIGKSLHLAIYISGWRYIKPNEGLMMWVKEKKCFYFFNGSMWQALNNPPQF